MRKVRWTTTRWAFPSRVRSEKLHDLLSKQKHKDLLGDRFLDGLEKRRDLVEARNWKLLSIQAPILIFLVFGLLNLNANVSILGVSVSASQSLREVLAVASALFGMIAMGQQLELDSLKEMIRTTVRKRSGTDKGLRDFLEVRYGVATNGVISNFNENFRLGGVQAVFLCIAVAAVAAVVVMVIGATLTIHVATLLQIYSKPNFSPLASYAVITFVLLSDILTINLWFLDRSFQPFQSLEDEQKLEKLRLKDEAKWKAVINEMVQLHRRKGWIRRTFGRPKLPRLP